MLNRGAWLNNHGKRFLEDYSHLGFRALAHLCLWWKVSDSHPGPIDLIPEHIRGESTVHMVIGITSKRFKVPPQLN